MRPRVLVILLGVVIALAAFIGFGLTQQRALSPEDAERVCRQQIRGGTPQQYATCLRAKQYPRAVPTSKAVLVIPLVFGTGALIWVGLMARRRPGGPNCPVCGEPTVPGDEDCLRCGAPLATT